MIGHLHRSAVGGAVIKPIIRGTTKFFVIAATNSLGHSTCCQNNPGVALQLTYRMEYDNSNKQMRYYHTNTRNILYCSPMTHLAHTRPDKGTLLSTVWPC